MAMCGLNGFTPANSILLSPHDATCDHEDSKSPCRFFFGPPPHVAVSFLLPCARRREQTAKRIHHYSNERKPLATLCFCGFFESLTSERTENRPRVLIRSTSQKHPSFRSGHATTCCGLTGRGFPFPNTLSITFFLRGLSNSKSPLERG